MINWEIAQEDSPSILASGLNRLKNAKALTFDEIDSTGYGNYLISHEGVHYVGEAQNLSKRLKQHSKETTSTFYKNYKNEKFQSEYPHISREFEISDFRIRCIPTQLGRKEMEEYTISNLPAVLNKVGKNKANKTGTRFSDALWDEVQNEQEGILIGGEEKLFSTEPSNWLDATPPVGGGVYLVENGKGEIIYFGESSALRKRYGHHSRTTRSSALRRNVGEDVLGLPFWEREGKKKRSFFSAENDRKVSEFLEGMKIRILAVRFSRFELEEYLIRKYDPLLNRKGKK